MKQAIREKLLRKRVQQIPLLKQKRDKKIIDKIEHLPEFQSANNILFYQPVFGEVEITPLFLKYSDHKNFFLPRVINKTKDLQIHKVEKLEDLEKGNFGIMEPKEHLETIDSEHINLILIPGIAFAPNGHRIGYGHGFFDKFLKKTQCPKIGIAYEFQMVKNIGGEPHDVPVNMIITNKRIIEVKHQIQQ